jgi:hypothetical protein
MQSSINSPGTSSVRTPTLRAGDVCEMPHREADRAPLAWHIRNGKKLCESHALDVDRGYAV